MESFLPRLVALLTGLRHAVAAFAARESRAQSPVWLGAVAYAPLVDPRRPTPLAPEVWTLLWHRLARLANRVQTLFARWQAGALPPPRPRAPRPYIPRPVLRLPAANGWINARIPEAAACAGMLHQLFQEPELPAFVAAVPRAARLLRPLAHALGLPPPDCLNLPPRPRKPVVSPRAPGRGQPDGVSVTPTSPRDRPLPPYVRAAARAWKKYDR